jgi:hypothetical protein
MGLLETNQVTRVALLSVFLFTFTLYGQEKSLSQLLEQKVEPMTIASDNTQMGLAELAVFYKIPMAVEVNSKEEKAASPQKVLIHAGTVRDVLDAVASCNPEYKVTVEKDIVRVSYKDASQNDPFLDVRVGEFQVVEQRIKEINKTLAETPEVKSWLAESGLELKSLYHNLGGENAPRASLSLKNATIREIFDGLVKTKKFKYWSLVRWGDNKKYIRIILW